MEDYTSIEDFFDEINSRAFRDGAREAVRHTQITGFETAFELDYVLGKGFIYPDKIWAGDENSVISSPNYERIAKARKKYLRETGILISDYSSQQDIYGFERFLRKNPQLMDSFDYPLSHDYTRKRAESQNIDFENSDIIFDLVNFHTHPDYFFFPSGDDLNWLDFTRTRNKIEGFSPISIIVSVSTNQSLKKRKFPSLIIQQQFPLPSPLCYDAEKNAVCVQALARNPKLSEKSELIRLVKESYDLRVGNFVVGKGFYFED